MTRLAHLMRVSQRRSLALPITICKVSSNISPHGLEARNESTESSSNSRSFSDYRRVYTGSLEGSRNHRFNSFIFSDEYAMNGLCAAKSKVSVSDRLLAYDSRRVGHRCVGDGRASSTSTHGSRRFVFTRERIVPQPWTWSSDIHTDLEAEKAVNAMLVLKASKSYSMWRLNFVSNPPIVLKPYALPCRPSRLSTSKTRLPSFMT